MIIKKNVNEYKGAIINRGNGYLYIPPDIFLRSHISHYCISFPTLETIPDNYTVLPSASSTVCAYVNNEKINIYYNGTNTKTMVVGVSANKNKMLLLIKFRTGGFYPFCKFNQDELSDFSLDLSCVNKTLSYEIKNVIIKSEKIEDLIAILNCIFISNLKLKNNEYITDAICRITAKNGVMTIGDLSKEMHYSEKHIRRLFLQYIGTSPKMFSRIVRVNYALWLLQKDLLCFADIIEKAEYFDQAHFIHDFKDVFNLTPSEYIKNMSVFYNTTSF